MNYAAHRRVKSKPEYVHLDGPYVDLYTICIYDHGFREFAIAANKRPITLNGCAWADEFDAMRKEIYDQTEKQP